MNEIDDIPPGLTLSYTDDLDDLPVGATIDPGYGQPTNQPALNIAQTMGKGKSFVTGAGHGLTQMGRAIEEAYLKMFGSESEKADLQKQIAMEKERYGQITGQFNPNAGWIKGGNLAGQVGAGLAIPTPHAKTMAGRALLNAAIGGGFEGLTTTGSFGDRAIAGGIGAFGGGVGSVGADLLTKGVGAARGKWTQPEAIERRTAMERLGLKPRIGDISDIDTGSMIKSGENLLANTPLGATRFAEDVGQLRRAIVPDRTSGRNVITEAANETDKGVSKLSNQIWQPFESFVTSNTVPGVRPTELKIALNDLLEHDSTFLSKIPGDKVRAELERLYVTPLNKIKSIPIQDYHNLMKSIGGLTPSVKAMSTPAPGATKIADKAIYPKFAALLEGINQDVSRLKGLKNPNAQEAYRLFDSAKKEWQEKVLPWKESDLAFKLKQKGSGAEDTANIVSRSDPDLAMRVRDYLKQYGPRDPAKPDLASDPMEALIGMNRQGQALANEAANPSILDMTKGVMSSPLAFGSRNKAVQNMYFGDPMLDDGLAELVRRVSIGIGRETGDVSGVTTAAILNMLGSSDKDNTMNESDPNYSHGVGAATQAGVMGR
jgi:hypothetical protein